MGRKVSKTVKALIDRLSSTERRIGAGGARKKFKRRAKRVYIKKTSDEKAAAALRKRERNSHIQADLQEGRRLLREHAEKMADKHGGHDANYYQRMITHSLTKHTKGTRKTSEWNVFVKQRLKEFKASMYVCFPHTSRCFTETS